MINIAKYSYLLASALLFMTASCSDIAEEDRKIEVELAPVKRNILIEDFTGQNCPNCPEAQRNLEEIQKEYGNNNIISVALHCGKFGFAGKGNYIGLMNDTANKYWNNWFTSSDPQPVVKINRGDASTEISSWPTMISTELQKTSDYQLSTIGTYDDTTRKLTINTTTLAKAKQGVTARLQLWLTEDNIVAIQKDGSKTIMDYVHNHVFREAINGTWGEEIKYAGDNITITNTFTIPDNYDSANCHVVAFIYTYATSDVSEDGTPPQKQTVEQVELVEIK